MLCHEGGMRRLSKRLPVEATSTEGILRNEAGKFIEEETLIYPTGYKRCYHSFTHSLILNEIFRRIQPDGNTLGQFWKK